MKRLLQLTSIPYLSNITLCSLLQCKPIPIISESRKKGKNEGRNHEEGSTTNWWLGGGRSNSWDKEGIIVHFESFLTYCFNC